MLNVVWYGRYVRTPQSTHLYYLPHTQRNSVVWYIKATYIRSGILLQDNSDTLAPFLCRKIPFTSLKSVCGSSVNSLTCTNKHAILCGDRADLYSPRSGHTYPLKMAEKVQGSVKWFSNRKGYGFITPAEGSSITEDIFVHQSSIFCEGYRTLVSQ